MEQNAKTALAVVLAGIIFGGCSFDYGESSADTQEQADLIMQDVEYVRVRDGDPLARFTAETAERFEKRQIMEVTRFSFEQFEQHGKEVSAAGTAGAATVELESGNIRMSGGVRLEVSSEDIIIETDRLDWQDKERRLEAGGDEEVTMRRSDGSNFSGRGFSAEIRERTWGFAQGIAGTYIWEDDEEGEEGETEGILWEGDGGGLLWEGETEAAPEAGGEDGL
ncbi:MAG: LPS export ABC transporter periplasmic protein LptC [Spirochaetaceae bacterium]|jgi:LPS export ABC transporter protein LptC|nr:LPS export ABC transporter periplasmic protein LptC [Spirochaetaceae bacterium]